MADVLNMASLTEMLPIEEGKPERTPEEAALVMRLSVFVRIRWFAVVLIIAATLTASLGFGIGFPTLPIYIVCGFIVVYNFVLLKQVKNLNNVRADLVVPRARTFGYVHIILDLVSAAAIMHFSGGIENPFIFLFAFHILMASIVLNFRVVYLLATLAIVLIMVVVGLEYLGVIPHENLTGFASPDLYKQWSYILAVLVSLELLLYVTTYTSTAVSGELRKRQRQVVQLRERLIEEKTGQLKKASSEVAKLEEERDRFLRFIGIAAHDLKAPLTAIQGFLWVMLGGYAGELSDKQKNMLERSTKRISELLTLISDLLDIPRIETGQIIQEKKVISLRQVIMNALGDLRNLAKEKGVKLNVELPQGLSHIRGSAPRLQQVITNLVNNAINYTPKGSITVRVKEFENELLVEVIDTGIGIPPEDLPKLFEDFFRASNVEARGTGLGLSIARRIVEAHGGKIWAESPSPETNTGSKFSFTLPKQRKLRRQRP